MIQEAHIRNIWNIFIKTCRTSYSPSSYVTIDKQLSAFRRRCLFRMYIPNKPVKYGMKIVMVCNASTKYMLDASPYLGKNPDKWFAPSGNLCKRFNEINSRYASPRNYGQLVHISFSCRTIATRSLQINHDRNCTLKQKSASKGSRNSKLVLLLSTMHEGAEIAEETGKPAIIHNHNEMKAGVDTFNQMCSNMSSSRKNPRWLLCAFFGMINIASINSHIIYVFNMLERSKRPVSRYKYMLIKPFPCQTMDDEKIQHHKNTSKYSPRHNGNPWYTDSKQR